MPVWKTLAFYGIVPGRSNISVSFTAIIYAQGQRFATIT